MSRTFSVPRTIHGMMLTGQVDTLEFDGQGRRYTISFLDTANIRVHILDVLLGNAYILPRTQKLRPSLIIDVGANIGTAALFFRHNFPMVPIICYEPATSNLAFLRINTKQIESVEIIPCAISEREGVGRLYHGLLYGLQDSLRESPEVDRTRFEDVKVLEAAKELGSKIIPGTLLKMDTEGCEAEILRSLTPHLNNIYVIYMEYHSEQMRREIDRLLENTHTLFSGKITDPHRGSLGYINTESMLLDSALHILEIR